MDTINWICFGPAKLIAEQAYAGFAIAAALIGLQAIRTNFSSQTFDKQWFRKAPVFTGFLWAIFNLYESQITSVLATNTAAPTLVRLDLLFLAPLLYALTGSAVHSLLFQVFLKRRKENSLNNETKREEK